MAHFELCEKVWWGDMQSPVVLAGRYRSVLDLASNYVADCHHYRHSQVPADAVYFRLPTDEDRAVTPDFCQLLEDIFSTVAYNRLFPLLVHCMAGQCRSPIVAAYAAWSLDGHYHFGRFTPIYDRVRSLRVDIDDKRAFHSSLLAHCLRRECRPC